MQDWERPYMGVVADIVAGSQDSVLEAGFGMGIPIFYVQGYHPGFCTVIKCN